MKKPRKSAPGQSEPKLDSPRSVKLNMLIRIAALTLHPLARLEPLAKKAGLTSESIRYAIRRGRFTPGAACALEIAVGRKLLPKEKLCPEKFK